MEMTTRKRDPYLTIEGVLTDEEKAAILSTVMQLNPRLNGAKVADLLDIYYEADSCLSITEPLYETYGRIGGDLHGAAVMAATLMQPSFPRYSVVAEAAQDLVKRVESQ